MPTHLSQVTAAQYVSVRLMSPRAAVTAVNVLDTTAVIAREA